jgi:hypothetical protein
MLGSGATFGYVSNVSSAGHVCGRLTFMESRMLTNAITECSCPSAALSEPKAPTTKPGVEPTQTLSSFHGKARNDDKN